jgi:glycosyltransferase involved in cell wall biosynthesis
VNLPVEPGRRRPGPAPHVGYVLATSEGGTGRHVAMLARGSAAAGLEVRVFGPASTRGFFDDVGFEPVAISDRPHPVGDAAAVRRLRGLLVAMNADVVHAHGMRAGALAALALRPFAGSRPAAAARWPGGRPPALVVTVHNAPPAGASAAVVYGLLERLVAANADVVLCVSSDLSARMRRLGAEVVGRAIVPAPEVRPSGPAAGLGPSGPAAGLGPSGPAAGVGPSGRRPADLPGDRPVILAAGRLAPQKGFGTLIAAASRWRDRRPEPLVAIAGAGPLAGALADQARDLGAGVRLLGRRDDIADLLAAADVFALPSLWEGQPLILQEALRAGRPIVAAGVGGVRDLTGDDAALLVGPGDPAAFADAVLSVLDDAGLAARLSKAAARRAAALPTESDAIAASVDLYQRLRS